MEEEILNIFLFVDGHKITEIGICRHLVKGTDEEKQKFLCERVHLDIQQAAKYPINPITHAEYTAKVRLGSHMSVFEPVFTKIGAPRAPLIVITPVVNGMPYVDIKTHLGPLNLDDHQQTDQFPGKMPDYLQFYMSDQGFDVSRLINDDYLLSIKLLWNNRKYVSATKLLLSMIDSIAYIEFGDKRKNFHSWLNQYADLSPLAINADELWEFRNSLLHMTNLQSRAVLRGEMPSLVMYVGAESDLIPQNTSTHKYFNLKSLIDAINVALGKWLETYTSNTLKLEKFIERYDLTVSDSRMAVFSID